MRVPATAKKMRDSPHHSLGAKASPAPALMGPPSFFLACVPQFLSSLSILPVHFPPAPPVSRCMHGVLEEISVCENKHTIISPLYYFQISVNKVIYSFSIGGDYGKAWLELWDAGKTKKVCKAAGGRCSIAKR